MAASEKEVNQKLTFRKYEDGVARIFSMKIRRTNVRPTCIAPRPARVVALPVKMSVAG
jgi:hypothetical protein